MEIKEDQPNEISQNYLLGAGLAGHQPPPLGTNWQSLTGGWMDGGLQGGRGETGGLMEPETGDREVA